MPDYRDCGRIRLLNDTEWTFEKSCRSTTMFYEQLLTSNYRAIKNAVFTALEIDRSTRRLKDNVLMAEDGTPTSVHDAYWQSKALAYELLVSYLFTCLDDPQGITSHCQLSGKGEPHSFATSGKADIVGAYDGFRVVIEVTSKKHLPFNAFRTQMRQAIKRAGELAADEIGGTVYALTINEFAIEKKPEMIDIYNSFLPIKPEQGDIRPVALWESDFLAVMKTLCEPRDLPNLHFDSSLFASALDRVYAALSQRVEKLELGWTKSTLLQTLKEGMERGGPGLDFGR